MKKLDDLLGEGVNGRRVLVRDDLNVPFDKTDPTVISDDGRIRAVLPTLTALRDAGAAIIVCSHLGRPKGEPDPKYSLAPVAARLGELLGGEVIFANDTVGPSAQAAVSGLSRGQVLRRVVLPQALRVIIPPTGNEIIAMVKYTSLVAFVPVTFSMSF